MQRIFWLLVWLPCMAGLLWAGDAPTISGPSSFTMNRDTTSSELRFSLSDNDTDLNSLTLSATATNRTLFPDGNAPSGSYTFGGSGANRTLTIKPAANLSGTTRVTVTVSDGTSTANQQIDVTVNAPPAIDGLPNTTTINQFNNPAVPSAPYTFTVTDDATAPASLTATATSLDTAIIADAGCMITTITPTVLGGPNRQLTVTPLQGKFTDSGVTVTVRVRVTDERLLPATKDIKITIKEVNRVPVISQINATINYSLNVSGYAQIFPDSVAITDPDGEPTIRTSANPDHLLTISNSVTANGVAGEDKMVARATNECVITDRGGKSYLSLRADRTVDLAEIKSNNDGSLELVMTPAAETHANTGNPRPGRAAVVSWLLKTIHYTNLSGRFAQNSKLARTLTLTLVEGRPAATIVDGQKVVTLTSVITPLLLNEPPANVAFADLFISPGGTGAIVLKSSNGPLPGFDDKTADDNLQFTLLGQPTSGQLIDLVTGATITTFLGVRLTPARAAAGTGIGYRNTDPNAPRDGLVFQVADVEGLFTTANLAVRISFGTSEARIVSDPLLVINRNAQVNYPLSLLGPTGSTVTLTIGALGSSRPAPGVVNATVVVNAANGKAETDANGLATGVLTINPGTLTADGYLAFLLTCTIGNSTTKQPFIIRLTPPVVPLSANN